MPRHHLTLLRGAKHAFNRVLRPLRLEFIRAGSLERMYDKLRREIVALERMSSELLFPDYPPHNDRRIELLANLTGTSVLEGIYVVAHLARCREVDGDVCEFGVAQGCTSALMGHVIRDTAKRLWLFDSFDGLPRPTPEDELKDDIFQLGSIEAYAGTMATPADVVRNRLAEIGFPNARANIVPGFVEDTTKGTHLPRAVCFAYVDLDFYSGIATALGFLDGVLGPSGVVVVDDYDYFSTGVKKAVDEFVAGRGDSYRLTFPIEAAGRFCILQRIR